MLADLEVGDLDQALQQRIVEIAELPALAVARDMAFSGEDVGVFVGIPAPRVRAVLVFPVFGAGFLGRDELEHEGLVFAVGGVGAWVDAEADVGVSPGAGAHGVGGVADGVFGEEDGCVGGKLVG